MEMPSGSGIGSAGTTSGRHVTPGGYAPRTSDGQQAISSSKELKDWLCRHHAAKGRCPLKD
ncbi:hypothetical protein AAVH_41095, partial [Aphelenchoides avenae]